MGVRTITDGATLNVRKPKRGYPTVLATLSDHIRKKRLDLDLTRKACAAILGADALSLKNWEERRTEIAVRFYPSIISFLGYNPIPDGQSQGSRIRGARMAQGWSRKRLASEAGVDEGTVKRLEADRKGAAYKPALRVLTTLDLTRERKQEAGS